MRVGTILGGGHSVVPATRGSPRSKLQNKDSHGQGPLLCPFQPLCISFLEGLVTQKVRETNPETAGTTALPLVTEEDRRAGVPGGASLSLLSRQVCVECEGAKLGE